jgi:quercetin dioxygenase-like cupin family protein
MTASKYAYELNKGDTWTNEVCEPHQLEALEDDSVIFEVSTPDDPKDSYRVEKGDSQS